MQISILTSAVPRSNPDQDVLRRLLGIFDEDIKVPIIVEYACINQFEFLLLAGPLAVDAHQFVVWIGLLRVFIKIFHVGVRWSTVEVEVVFFNVLTVISLTIREAKGPLLENRIVSVPQRKGETEYLL